MELRELMHDPHVAGVRIKFEECKPISMHKFGMIPTGSCVGVSLPANWVKRRRSHRLKRLKPIRRVIDENKRLMMYDWSKCLCAHKRRAKIYLRWRGEYHAK